MEDGVISGAQLAAQLKCNRSRIAHLARSGLPRRPDRRYNRAEALTWIAHHLGDGRESAGRGQSLRARASALLAGKDLEAVSTAGLDDRRQQYQAIRGKLPHLTNLMLAAGLPAWAA